MNLITVNITSLREKLSDYLILVMSGRVELSVRNAKNGNEVARIVGPLTKDLTKSLIDCRIEELKKIAGFASEYPNKNREKLEKMGRNDTKKLLKGTIE
ncbi:hypothetical protein COT44_01595 [Candidatus Shapirobacteria bacterium CG08_land_8_20_14_0_20_39_18]|uniref:Uncharacterized protein n=1 Tax=Candidatus Shapirobacteria bacterium CG08_land_8_20_14_0_20_39_18 TaxID=1974883 RepID=A0A2M6XDI9_9BACT|nr:MAG: hypothetical protein COT44_01595 [Candidatus Shapirobacteria bacterium CG08_land_8_20_14_0_20_39_18]PIY65164.1 MAG: hypothetical protein COY91_03855 [Candidatus Shapirobacteria bacterium CG_4_10_14_0_8_um_filter_39_15]PJE67950.1 MAG: hypothetical protein COU94_04440 [Candidatus Shapirobacteria bacterium CG10_big_fil_rev_8_21_14_0_10_38_8]